MRFAYADPPYIGQARRHYADEAAKAARVASEVDHRMLIADLMGYDGWALSLSSATLEEVLGMCREICGPKAVRVAAWVKPFAFIKPWIWPAYAWEPVIFRRPKGRRHLRTRQTPMDWVQCNPYGVSEKERTNGHGVKGSKPETFCFWLFNLLDLRPNDDFADLFPGSGGVGRAWMKYSRWDPAAAIVPSDTQLSLDAVEHTA